jgi:tRNA-dihydrouridine synthase B
MRIYPDNAVIMAPLAGYTDLPYRQSCRRHGCFYAFTEMVDTGSLVYSTKNTRKFLDRGQNEEWLGIQIVGCKLNEIEKSVEIINEHDFNVLDLNIGCPTPKVVKKGKGASLSKDPEHVAKIIELMVKKSRVPVTAKIRIQDTIDPEKTVFLAKKIEESGAQALTVHGRLLSAIYSGPCYADIISAVRESVKIQVIANGGVMGNDSYHKLKDDSGCSEIMIARGAMGNPWIFEEIKNDESVIPSTEGLANEMELHIVETISYYGENFGCKLCRKLILDYLGGRGFSGEFKSGVVKLSTLEEFKNFMRELRKGPTERYKKWLERNLGFTA